MMNSPVELISVHIPKCAGTSFAQILSRNYPAGLHMDYEDQPLDPQKPFQQDFAAWKEGLSRLRLQSWSSVKVIHGHFWAGKYDTLFPHARKIIWVRHPIRRLVSHYYYWKSVPELPHSLHKLMREQNLSLIEFAEHPQMRNILQRTFLRSTTLDEFAFIGVQEHFAHDLDCLAGLLNWRRRRVPQENRTAHRGYEANSFEPDTEKKLRLLNEGDLEMYQAALEIRGRRMRRPRFWLRISNAFKTARRDSGVSNSQSSARLLE